MEVYFGHLVWSERLLPEPTGHSSINAVFSSKGDADSLQHRQEINYRPSWSYPLRYY